MYKIQNPNTKFPTAHQKLTGVYLIERFNTLVYQK